MNITVSGASGATGGHVAAIAAQRGHRVCAVYRQAPAAPPAGAETVIAPDVFAPGLASMAVKGADVVVSAVGPNFTTRHNPRTAMTSPPACTSAWPQPSSRRSATAPPRPG
jgi:putative NADH-flavin reductase